MRGAKCALASFLLLVSCGKQVPDFNYAIHSPKNGIVAVISGFQPRGTIEGSLVISFGKKSNAHTITITKIKNGSIGWLDSGRLWAKLIVSPSPGAHADENVITGTLSPCGRRIFRLRQTE